MNKSPIDYSIYVLTLGQKGMVWLVAGGVFFSIGYIFYQNLWIALLSSLVSFGFISFRGKQLLRKRKMELNYQFKQGLFSLASSLSAGRSIENAFHESVNDLKLLYTDVNTLIILEFTRIHQKIRNGDNVEKALLQFSQRADLEDIRNFTDVFMICKRSGGNLVEVIRRTANVIGEKIEMEQEIALSVAQKKFESNILTFAPIVIVAVLAFSSPDYMEPLYQEVIGRIIMTLCLGLLGCCWWFTQKIMDIQV